MLEDHLEPRQSLDDAREHAIDERLLPVEHVDARIGDLAVHLQHEPERRHGFERPPYPLDRGHAGVRMRRRPRGVELGADDETGGARAPQFLRGRPVRQVESHDGLEVRACGQRIDDALAVRGQAGGVGHRRLQVRHHERARKPPRRVRQHGGELRAVAQMQVPVVWPAQREALRHGRSRRPRNAGSARSRDAKRTPNPVNSVGTWARPPLRSLADEVEVHPGERCGHEAVQKPRRQDVITLAFEPALQHIGDGALEIAVEILVHREAPDPLAARTADALQVLVHLGPVGECAAVALGERVDTGARQRREVEHQRRALARRERERVGQHHSALGVAVHDLYGHAVERADHLLRTISARADLVLRDCEPAIDLERHPAPRERKQCSDRDGAALHVAVHQVHAAVRLEIHPARVETDALADECEASRDAPSRPVSQPDDAGRAMVIAA